MTDVARHEYTTLDALRGVAAIIVALFHFSRFYSSRGGFPNGYIAVDVFFILSGFIIAHSYDDRLTSGMSVSCFIRLRFARLTPMIAVGTLLGMAIEMSIANYRRLDTPSLSDTLIIAVFSIVDMPNLISKDSFLFPLNGPQWTLFYEIVVNALYALFIGFLTTRRIAICIIAAAFFWSFYVISNGSADLGFAWNQAGGGFARVIAGFSIGVMLRRTYSVWSSKVPLVSPALIVLLLIALLDVPIPAAARSIYDLAATLLIAPLIVALGSLSELSIQQRRTGQFLATISYPLYAIHYPFTKVVETYVPVSLQAVASFLLIAALIPGCWFLSRLFEKPATAFLRTLLIAGPSLEGATRG